MTCSPNPFTAAILRLLGEERIAHAARAWVVDQGAPDDTADSVRAFCALQLEDARPRPRAGVGTATAVALLASVGKRIDWAAVDRALAGPEGYDWPEEAPAGEPPGLYRAQRARSPPSATARVEGPPNQTDPPRPEGSHA